MNSVLFDKGPMEKRSPQDASEASAGNPRLRVPHRTQVEIRWASLDELLESDHAVRVVWQAVCGLDLTRWLERIRSVEGHVGRDATDPRVLLALWVYATLQGVASARELARLCEKHVAYQWLCGGVTVNYHLLADFRSQNAAAWDELLSQMIAALLVENLVTMHRVAQDGMRTRASAGKSSFRRPPRLAECLAAARAQVQTLRRLAEEAPEELSQRQLAARERAAGERGERIGEAIRHCQQLEAERGETAAKSGRKPREARGVARTDGHRRGQGHLPSPAAERRMGPCSGQEPGPAANAGARPREMPQCRCVVCDRS